MGSKRALSTKTRAGKSRFGYANVSYLRQVGERRFLYSLTDAEGISRYMQANHPSLLTERVAQSEILLQKKNPTLGGEELRSLGEAFLYTQDVRLLAFYRSHLSRWGAPAALNSRRKRSSSDRSTPWERTSRLWGWFLATHSFLRSPSFDGGDVTHYVQGILRECEGLAGWVEREGVPRHERAAALAGLAAAGMLYREIYQDWGWEDRGLGELAADVHEYLDPGASVEESLVRGLQTYLPLLALSLRSGLEVPAEVLAQVEEAIRVLQKERDSANARARDDVSSSPSLVPLIPSGSLSRRFLIQAALLLLGDDDVPRGTAELDPDVLFLLGPPALA